MPEGFSTPHQEQKIESSALLASDQMAKDSDQTEEGSMV